MDQTKLEAYRAQYREQGFFVVPDLLNGMEIQRFREVIDVLMERSREVRASDAVFDLEPDHSREQPRVRRIKAAHRVDPVFADFMRHPQLIEVLTAILGPDVRHQYVKLNTKAADGGSPLEWHQDWAFYPHTNDAVLAVALMIDNVTLDNGPTLLVPAAIDHGAYSIIIAMACSWVRWTRHAAKWTLSRLFRSPAAPAPSMCSTPSLCMGRRAIRRRAFAETASMSSWLRMPGHWKPYTATI